MGHNLTPMRSVAIRAASAALLRHCSRACSLFAEFGHNAPPPPPPPPPPAPPQEPPPSANERFELAPGPGRGRRGAGGQGRQGRHAHRHRAALQRRLRGDRARQSQGRSLAARGGTRASSCPRSSSCRMPRAPGSSSTSRRCASSITRRPRRASRRWSTPIRSASARSAGVRRKASPRSSAARRIRPGACRSRCARSTTRTARTWSRSSAPGPTIRSASTPSTCEWPSYLIHGTNKPAGVGLRSSHGCIRLYPEDIEQFFDMVPDRHPGAGGQPAVRVRLARRAALHAGLRRARGRHARLERRRRRSCSPSPSRPRLQQQVQAAQRAGRLGPGRRVWRAARAACRCRSRATDASVEQVLAASAARAERTAGGLDLGWHTRTCRWTRPPSSRWSRRSEPGTRAHAAPAARDSAPRARAGTAARRRRRTAAEVSRHGSAVGVAAADARRDRAQAGRARARAAEEARRPRRADAPTPRRTQQPPRQLSENFPLPLDG